MATDFDQLSDEISSKLLNLVQSYSGRGIEATAAMQAELLLAAAMTLDVMFMIEAAKSPGSDYKSSNDTTIRMRDAALEAMFKAAGPFGEMLLAGVKARLAAAQN